MVLLYRKGYAEACIPILTHIAQPDIPATFFGKVAVFLTAVKHYPDVFHGSSIGLAEE